MVWRRAVAASLPLLSSSMRARVREDGLGEEEGGGSGPNVLGGEVSGEDVGVVFSGEVMGLGEEGGLGKRAVFLWKKVGLVNRPSKG